VHKPAIIRSVARRLGARLRPRLRISSCCRSSTDSATTDRSPVGLASRHEKDGVADAERDAFVAFAMEENRDGPDDLAIPVEPQAARRS
jgi:hypothetical protein